MQRDMTGMTPRQIQDHYDKVKYAKDQKEKLDFENSLRSSVNYNTGLFGTSQSMFEQRVTKDIKQNLSLMERKRKMKLSMNTMIEDLSESDFNRFESTMIEFNLSK